MTDALAPLSKAGRMLAEAKTLDEILHVENLAQRARDFAKAEKLGREAQNQAGRIMLDARRKAGDTLRLMKERGELADRGDNQHTTRSSQAAITTLADLGLTLSQSSRYQAEASVPEAVYLEWIEDVLAKDEGYLSAAGLRRQVPKPPRVESDPDPIPDGLPLNSIVHGDNCQVMEVFPDDCVHLVVTSPPYDSLREYGGHTWDFEGVATHLLRVICPGGVLVWVVADQVVNGGETGTSLRQAIHLQDKGFRLHDTMIYRTNKPPTSGKRYQHCWEYMFVFSKGDPETFNAIREPCTWAGYKTAPTQRDKDGNLLGGNRRVIQDTKVKENIWYYQAGSGKTEKTDHPASFPLQLALDHVKTWTNEGDVVLDPFCGSGTTCRAAADLGRQWIGIEVDSQYAEMAKTRLAVERHPLLVEVQDDHRSIA